MAFSGPKVEEEFVNQKQDFIDEELGINQKKLAVLKDGLFDQLSLFNICCLIFVHF